MTRKMSKADFKRASISLFVRLFFICMVVAVPFVAAAAVPFVGHIKTIEKESEVLRVRVLRPGKTDAPSAVAGAPVFQGDTIRTDEGVRIQVELSDGSNIFIGPGSTVQMKDFFVNPSMGKRSMTLKGLQGTFRFLVSKLFKNKVTGIETEWKDSGVLVETHTAVAGVKGTDFVVSIGEFEVEIAVFEGLVRVKNADGSVVGELVLSASQLSRIMRGAKPGAPIALTPQMRNKLLRLTTPSKVLSPAGKGPKPGTKKGKAQGDLGIAKDLAEGVPLKDIMNAAVEEGVPIQAVVAEALLAGVDPAYVVFTAVSEGYDAQAVVATALGSGVLLDTVVNAAIIGGADSKSIYVGAAEAGASPAAVATEITASTTPVSPVFGATTPTEETPTEVIPGVVTPLPSEAVGGGETPSTQPASPYVP